MKILSILDKTTLLLLTLFLLSCSHKHLHVHRQVLSHTQLMSGVIQVNDERNELDIEGERITISWKIPKNQQDREWVLDLELIYNDFTHEVYEIPIIHPRDTYEFQISNKKYKIKQGIRSYRLALRSNEDILEEWRHPLWTEIIVIEDED